MNEDAPEFCPDCRMVYPEGSAHPCEEEVVPLPHDEVVALRKIAASAVRHLLAWESTVVTDVLSTVEGLRGSVREYEAWMNGQMEAVDERPGA